MTLTDYIIISILAIIIALALRYIIKKKKSGAKCIGCPDGENCSAKSENCCCGCSNDKNKS